MSQFRSEVLFPIVQPCMTNTNSTSNIFLSTQFLSYIFTAHFPAPASFLVPHSLSLDQENGILFLADRENGRILAFDRDTGKFITKLDGFGSRIFAVHYSPTNGKFDRRSVTLSDSGKISHVRELISEVLSFHVVSMVLCIFQVAFCIS